MQSNLMFNKGILFATIIVAITVSTISFNFETTNAEPIVMDINKTGTLDSGYSGEKIGTLTIDAKNKTLDIAINMTADPAQDKVFEAWLVDSNGSDYTLSLGAINGNNLMTSSHMVNPYTYSELIITEEPVDDPDPKPADTYGGVELQAPFKQ